MISSGGRGGGALKKNGAERSDAPKFVGYFVCKFTILRKKSIFFNCKKGGGGGAPLHKHIYIYIYANASSENGRQPDHCLYKLQYG